MHPFARQLLGWHATNPERRAAALVLELKGDFCHDIRRMLTELGRAEDYVELSLDGRLTWNPLSATWLDSYSLAYTVASLLNQLFGKGKEPFWQLAYTNLVRWIIELYRVLPGGYTPPARTLSQSSVQENSGAQDNLSMRMHMRRFTRLTNGFSKKLENHVHMVALYTVFYNWTRIHKTLRTSPAQAAGLTDRLWDMADVVKLIEAAEAVAPTAQPN